jgi:hypothetical protein
MKRTDCVHPANRLLPFYLNGSLEGDEQISVREHVGGCERCALELDTLSDLAAGMRGRRLPILDAAAERRPWGRWHSLAAAAAIALPLLAVVFLARPRPVRSSAPPVTAPSASAPQPAAGPIRVAAMLDLGGGPTRDAAAAARLVLRAEDEAVTIRFAPPIGAPGASSTLALRSASGKESSPERVRLSPDPLGRVTAVFPAALFSETGGYALLLREDAGEGAVRLYEFPFQVERAADADR